VAAVGFGEERGAVALTRGTTAEDGEVDYGSGGRRRCGSWRGRRLRCRRPTWKTGGSEAVGTPDEAAVATSHRGRGQRRLHGAALKMNTGAVDGDLREGQK
jgi:hypothetical protein